MPLPTTVGSSGDELLPATAATTFNTSALPTTTLTMSASVQRYVQPGAVIRIRGTNHTVAETGTAVQEISVSSAINGVNGLADAADDGMAFLLTYNGTNTTCIPLDAEATEVQDALNAIALISSSGGVQVIRSFFRNESNHIEGYTYEVYFVGGGFSPISMTYAPIEVHPTEPMTGCLNGSSSTAPSDLSITVAETSAVGDPLTLILDDSTPYAGAPSRALQVYLKAEIFRVSTNVTRPFTATSLPLSPVEDPMSNATSIRALQLTNVALYRTSGFTWFVSFDSHLGDVSPIMVTGAYNNDDGSSDFVQLLSAPAQLITADNFAPAYLPLSTTISGLQEGVPYFARVSAGNAIGLSAASPSDDDTPASDRPRGRPGAPQNVQADALLHVDEVQVITTAATHRDEIQRVTSSADVVPEQQTITLGVRNSPGAILNGTFALELNGVGTQHEKQLVTVSATTGPGITRGQFRLNLGGNVTAVTNCIDFDATAAEVEAAIEGAYPWSDVVVTRQGDGTATSNYGYSWMVVFLTAGPDPGDSIVLNVTDGPDQAAAGLSQCANDNPMDGSWSGGTGHAVSVTTLDEAGSDLSADTTVAELEAELALVAQAVGGRPVVGVQKTLADAEGAVTFTLSLNGIDGDANEFVCRSENLTAATGTPFCNVETRTAGNAISGSFRLRFRETAHSAASELTGSLQHSASAADVETALEDLVGIGNVTVGRSEPGEIDGVGGFEWTVTFLGFGSRYGPLREEDRGDVPMLETVDALRGKGAKVTVTQVVMGNELGGTFRLLRGGHQTAELPFDSSASAVQTALQQLSGGGAVEVSRASAAAPDSGVVPDSQDPGDFQNGFEWRVTFVDAVRYSGDVDLLGTDGHGLSGDGAVAHAMELLKGSEASANGLRVSFDPPASTGGDLPSSYLVEWDTASSFSTSSYGSLVYSNADYLLGRQIVTVEVPEGVDVNASLGGGFELAYGGTGGTGAIDDVPAESLDNLPASLQAVADATVSRPLAWNATAEEVRDALEALPSVSAATVTVDTGASYPQDRRRVFVVDIIGKAGSPQPIRIHSHQLTPASTARITVQQRSCDRCVIIPGLTAGQAYYVRVSARNAIGATPSADVPVVFPATPRSVPGKPTDVRLEIFSGTELELFFSPPISDGGDPITSYCVQWDTASTFASGSNSTAVTCGDGTPLGSAVVTGAALAGAAPYTFVIDGLTTGTRYFARVFARNSVPFQTVSHTGMPPSNRQYEYSAPSSLAPAFIKPTTPQDPAAQVLYGDEVRVTWRAPRRSGGRDIIAYVIEYDLSTTFASGADGEPTDTITLVTQAGSGANNATLTPIPFIGDPDAPDGDLDEDRTFYHDVSGLEPGRPVYFRIAAVAGEGVGQGNFSAVAQPAPTIPSNAPESPTQVTAVVVETDATELLGCPTDTMTAEEAEHAPLTHIDVAWRQPAATSGDSISKYRVEWFESNGHVAEVQQVQVEHATAGSAAGSFALEFKGERTQLLPFDTSPEQLRFALMSMGNGTGNADAVVGHVEVTREPVPASGPVRGYRWQITFADQTVTPGNQPELLIDEALLTGSTQGQVTTLTQGRTANGVREVGVIRTELTSAGRAAGDVVRGHFRLRFRGSGASTLVAYNATEEDVARAVEQLVTTSGNVDVSREVGNSSTTGEYVWRVTFGVNEVPSASEQDVSGTGLPDLLVDSSPLYPAATASVVYIGGDYEVDASDQGTLVCGADPVANDGTGHPSGGCAVGQRPAGYGFAEVDHATFAYRITGLTAGQQYAVRVSSVGALHGGSEPAVATGSPLELALRAPSAPRDLFVRATDGRGDALNVTFDAPLFDGGDDVVQYRIEVSETADFANVLHQDVRCPNFPRREVQTVEVAPPTASDVIDHNSTFQLRVTLPSGETRTTQAIYAVAVGPASEETLIANGGEGVWSEDASLTGGSMEAALEELDGVTSVTVERVPGGTGGAAANNFVWRITFNDDGDFGMAVATDNVNTTAGDMVDPVVRTEQDGEVFNGGCDGVPQIVGGLTQGTPYHVRVFAYNSAKGFGPAAITNAATPVRPATVPGLPRQVSLTAVSGAALRVVWSPPSDDGGREVDRYVIETRRGSATAAPVEHVFTSLSTGSPYQFRLTNLDKGVSYFVFVRAGNAIGLGERQASTPASEYPREAPSAPSNVVIGVTSGRANDSKITIGYDLPLNNGGDAVSSFVVEWDVQRGFDSFEPSPNKGSAEVPVSEAMSYTIPLLTPGRQYYVRVRAKNRAGLGAPSNTLKRTPTIQVPGKPSSASVTSVSGGTCTSGAGFSCIEVQWGFPRVPAHGIFCGGGGTADPNTPSLCPALMGRGNEADGGSPITGYRIEYSTTSSFDGAVYSVSIGETEVLTGEPFAELISDLPIGQTYYVRVAAVNAKGISSFTSATGVLGDGTQLSATVA